MSWLIVRKLHIQTIGDSTLYAAARARIGQKMYGIIEEKIVAGHRSTRQNIIDRQAVR